MGERLPRIKFAGLVPAPGDPTQKQVLLNLVWDDKTYSTVFDPEPSWM